MRVRWPGHILLLPNKIWNIILLLGLFFITVILTARVITPRNITALTGNPVTFTCDLDGEGEIVQVEWNRCDGQKVFIFHRDHGINFNMGYQERISEVMSNRFTLLEMRANDSGDYCCVLSTFPHGTLNGKITLLLQKDKAQVPSSTSLIASIVGGILGIAVLVGIIALLVLYQGRRGRIRNTVHVAVHSRGLPRDRQSFLMASPSRIRRGGPKENDPEKEDEEEEEKEEGADYFNVMTSNHVNSYSISPKRSA